MDFLFTSASFISTEFQTLLLEPHFLIPTWKWIVLFGGILIIFSLKLLFKGLLFKIKKMKFLQTENNFTNHLLNLNIELSLSWLVMCFFSLALVESLSLPESLDKYLTVIFKLIFAINVIRLVYLSMNSLGFVIQGWASKTESTIDDQLAPLATKTLKVLVIIIGFLVILQNFGVNVTALLAGLGLGGVAIAFAAQDTVANVFGTITILLDSPFKLGDRIKVADVDGIVEEVGFRSTRIRTFYNSIVSIPNSVVAKEKIDNLSLRNNIFRFRTILGFTYNAKPADIEKFIDHLHYSLKQDPRIDPTRTLVHFNEFAESSLNVLVQFHFKIDDPALELKFQENYLFQIHQLATQNNLDFAFPSRTVYMKNI